MSNPMRESIVCPKTVLRYGEEDNFATFFVDRIVIEGNKITYFARFEDGRHIKLARRLTDREVGYIYETKNTESSMRQGL